jgi:hypothetical protein
LYNGVLSAGYAERFKAQTRQPPSNRQNMLKVCGWVFRGASVRLADARESRVVRVDPASRLEGCDT